MCQAVPAGGGVPLQVGRVQQRQQALHPQQGRQENSVRGLQIRSWVSQSQSAEPKSSPFYFSEMENIVINTGLMIVLTYDFFNQEAMPTNLLYS